MTNIKKTEKIPFNYKFSILIFLLAVASGLFWNHQYFFKPVSGGDEGQYECIANTLLEEGFYSSCGQVMNREPVYPFFIAGIFAVTGSHPDSVRIVQLVIFGVICVFVYFLGRKYIDEIFARYSALFLALWWALANYTGRYTRELLMALLLLLLVYAYYKFGERYLNRYMIVSGVILGLLVLLNSVTQFLLVFFVLNFVFIFKDKMSVKQILLYIFTLIILFGLTISPWLIRNNEKYGAVSISAVPNTGFVLAFRVDMMEALYPEMPKYFFGHLFGYYFAEKLWPDLDIMRFRENHVLEYRNSLLEDGQNIVEVDNRMASQAKEKILEQPHKYILMSALDFINLNSPLVPQRIFGGNSYVHHTFAEGRMTSVPEFIKAGILIIFRLWWYFVLALVGYGFYHAAREWRKFGWILIVILYFNLMYSAVHAIPRYISPVYPFYAILAFYGLMILYKNNKLPILKYKKDEK